MNLLTAATRITRALFGLKDSGRRASARVASVVLLTGLLSSAIPAAELTINQGVVVKFGAGAGLIVRDKATIQPSTVFTSQADDSAGGQSNSTVGVPTQASWRGIRLEKSASAFGFTLTDSAIRYAGSASDATVAALSLRGFTPTLRNLLVSDSALGLRLSEVGSPIVRDSSFLRNTTGVEVSGNSTPTFATSEFVGNTSFAISNLTPASVVQATGNWWGAASGPKDSVGSPGNPNGQGDRVSLGVNYGAFTLAEPPIGCSIKPASGVFTTAVRAIDFTLACRNAIEVRLAETVSGLAGVAFTAITNTVTFTLSPAVGSKTVYAEFRGTGGVSALTTVVTTDQPIVYSPNSPQVTITAPLAGVTVTADTVVSATAVDSIAINSVQFLIGGQSIGLVSQSPYSANWNVAGFANGGYQIEVRATNALGAVGSSTIAVTLAKPQTDFSGPAISAIKWNNATLNAGDVLSAPGTLSFQLNDATGLGSATATLGVNVLSTWALSGTQQVVSIPVTFQDIANGSYILRIDARDSFGNASTNSTNVVVTLPAPSPAPTITRPTNNQTVSQSSVPVGGTAPIGTLVQLYLNSIANGGLLQVDGSGNWASSVALPAEGSFALTADARNVRGITAKSAAVTVSFAEPGPQVGFSSPGGAATITADSVIEVAVTPAPSKTIVSVALVIDGQTVRTFTSPPYRFSWSVGSVTNGPHNISATATDSVGRTGTASVTVNLQKPPAPIITPYIGRVDTVTPSVSYGTSTITITGRAVGRTDNQAVANAALKLILQNNGFERRIGTVTDSSGAFTFNFVPSTTDTGTYTVALIHPDENTTPTVQGNFAINRLLIDTPRLSVRLPRGFAQPIRVNVSTPAGLTASGVTAVANEVAQPSGALPAGMTITSSAVNVSSGGTSPLDFTVNTNASTPATGSIILSVVAADSGSTVRNEIRVDFEVFAPASRLLPNPSYIQSGVQRGRSASDAVRIENKGLAAAQNVTVQLISANANPLPAWLYLASASQLGNIAAGSAATVQVTAAPDGSAADGIYDAKLRVSENGVVVGDVAVSIAVTSADTGIVVFKVADIYTQTLDQNNQLIPGLAGVSIRLQNDAVATQIFDITSNGQGEANSGAIPSGRYRYRASAPRHADTSGMVTVRPGSTALQNLFLDYQVVSFEWSVTETTIQDRYDVNITATFQTQVPAPVIIMEPSAVNLPDMQVGEEFTGEITISNYGLLRADNVRFNPPTGNEYFRIDVQGSVPSQLEAKGRIVLPYKVTQIQPFPGLVVATGAAQLPLVNGLKRLSLSGGAGAGAVPQPRIIDIRAAMARGIGAQLASNAGSSVSSGNPAIDALKAASGSDRQKASSCYNGCSAGDLQYEFTCANGDKSTGSAGTSFCKTYGSCAGGGTGSPYGTGGGDGGGWGGGSGGSGSIPLSPKCTPDCPSGTCCNPPGGSAGS